jgi:feruloyl esterase
MKRCSVICQTLVVVAVFSAAMSSALPAVAASCEGLSQMVVPDTTITLAQAVPAGAFQPPKPHPSAVATDPNYQGLPSFCRVAASIHPTKDSDIKFEVWMPISGWNGKFEGIGNGGLSGQIFYPFMSYALSAGYATASTDTGHEGSLYDASFGAGHPEKVIDSGFRSVHEMTLKAKAIIQAFYGNGPRLSYWNGCSTGGRQGLMEAQRYPDDYNGIIAGASANFYTHLRVSRIWNSQAALKEPAGYIPPSQYPLIHDAVLAACDARDGVKDGLIADPPRCHFNPAVLQCKDGSDQACLTAAQVETARKIYAGPVNPRTGAQIFPGLEPGSELNWGSVAAGPKPDAISDSFYKNLVFKNPAWDFRTLNFDKDVSLGDELYAGIFNATDPNLRKFFSRGGKLILYHGWADPQISPRNSVNYFKEVVGNIGDESKAANLVRLFMVPGMSHCGGGDGPNLFDLVPHLDQWVDKGTAPNRVIASRNDGGKVTRTRPLCPYPQVAQYRGSGSTDEAENFVCKAP